MLGLTIGLALAVFIFGCVGFYLAETLGTEDD